jgi:hypothetical protein
MDEGVHGPGHPDDGRVSDGVTSSTLSWSVEVIGPEARVRLGIEGAPVALGPGSALPRRPSRYSVAEAALLPDSCPQQ